MALRAMCKYYILLTHYYLEGSPTPVDMVMDHKNLEYFSITKLLTHCQVRWSEFLCQFNLIIWFHPRCLSTKPNALTRQWDVYPKEGGSNYASINPTNLQPVFIQEQLASSGHDLYSLYIPFIILPFSYFPHCSSTISLCLASPEHCACFLIPFIPIELTLSQ